MFDRDGDGFVDKEEMLYAFGKSHEFRTVSLGASVVSEEDTADAVLGLDNIAVNEIFAMYDSSGDGQRAVTASGKGKPGNWHSSCVGGRGALQWPARW